MNWSKSLRKPQYWIVALAAALATLHLTILDQSDKPNLMSLSILVWLTIASLVWDKKDQLKLDSGIFSSFLGGTLIVFVLLRSISPAGYHLLISPFVSGLGLGLIASGVKGLNQYWKELFILGLLALSSTLESMLMAIDLPLLTAKFSNIVLWATGFNSYREGLSIILPTGRVEVYGACSGVESIMLMFFIAILFLFIVPLNRIQQTICIIVGVVLGFLANVIRVAIMAVLVAFSNEEAFKYWHGDDGSLVFALVSVLIFGMFCWLTYVRPISLTTHSEEDVNFE